MLHSVVCFGSALIAFSLAPGCQPNYVEDSWTRVRVTFSTTDDPIEGVRLVVPRFFEFGQAVDVLYTQPTDSDGQTVFPVSRVGDRPFAGDLIILVAHENQSEELHVVNQSGATAEGSQFRLRILDDGAASPGAPVPIIDAAANHILIDGYVGFFMVCSCATGRMEWGFEGIGFVGRVSPEVVPDGFGAIDRMQECPTSAIGTCANGFVAVAFPVFENTFRVSQEYCSNDGDAVAECLDEVASADAR